MSTERKKEVNKMKISTLYFFHRIVPAIQENPFEYLTVMGIAIALYLGVKVYKNYCEKRELKKYCEKLKKRVEKIKE